LIEKTKKNLLFIGYIYLRGLFLAEKMEKKKNEKKKKK